LGHDFCQSDEDQIQLISTLVPSQGDWQSSLANTGSFNYLILFSENANTFEFMLQEPFSFVLTRNGKFTLPGTTATTYHSGKYGGEMVGDGIVFTRRELTNGNFQSFLFRSR
jgi:hypothetical protein